MILSFQEGLINALLLVITYNIASYCIPLLSNVLGSLLLHYIALSFATVHYVASYCIVLYCIILYCVVSQCFTGSEAQQCNYRDSLQLPQKENVWHTSESQLHEKIARVS